jgi:hypothetical protein
MKTRMAQFMLMIALGLSAGCITSRAYDMPCVKAEETLLSRLDLNYSDLGTQSSRIQARADDSLQKFLPMGVYAIDLLAFEPGSHLSFLLYHRYDIGATGANYCMFDLRAQGTNRTAITVDYSDRWRGCWPPFFFLSPGILQERGILKEIWGNSSQ